MTLEQWCRARVNAEHLAYLDRDTKGYFAAVDFAKWRSVADVAKVARELAA